MNRKEIVSRTLNLLKQPLADKGFVLWYVDWYKDQEGMQLLVEVDREGGVSIDDCSAANEIVNGLLDEADFIPDSYTLEVASAGLTRELRNDFQMSFFIGTDTEITLSLYAPVDGRKTLTGTLADFDDRSITLDCGGEAITLQRSSVASVKAELYDETSNK